MIPQGKIPFAFSMLEEFRKLKLPVDLDNGELIMTRDYTVCTKGQILTPEQCRILVCCWIGLNNGCLEVLELSHVFFPFGSSCSLD